MLLLDISKLPPSQLHFVSDETTVDISTNETSPYEIRADDDRKYNLFCGTENFGAVRFTERPSYSDKKTSIHEKAARGKRAPERALY